MSPSKRIDECTRQIIGAAIRVHTAFGPGLFEKAYVPPLVWELEDLGLKCVARVPLAIAHRGRVIPDAYLIDLLVEDLVVVELKAIEALHPVHLAQLITYVRLARKPAGLLINFNVKHLKDGIKRIVY